MAWPLIIAGIGAAVDAGVSIWNSVQQQENQKYMRSMQETMLSREDTSIARRVNDLRTAGMSPVLAAGQGAQTSTPIRTEPPQINSLKGLEISQVIMQMAQQKAQIDQTNAQSKLIAMQEKKVGLENQWLSDTLPSRTEAVDAGLAKIYADTGVSRQSEKGQQIANAYNEVANPKKLEQLGQEIRNLREDEKIKKLTQLQQDKTITKTAEETAKIILEQSQMKQMFPGAKWKQDQELANLMLASELTKIQTAKAITDLGFTKNWTQGATAMKDIVGVVTDVINALKQPKVIYK